MKTVINYSVRFHFSYSFLTNDSLINETCTKPKAQNYVTRPNDELEVALEIIPNS